MGRKKKEVIIKAYKGFEHDWTCRGFQYEVGKSYEQDGNIKVCNNGFHACEEPLRVFGYYSPCDAKGRLRKFAEVEQSGEIAKDDDKTASSKINIKAELSILDLAKLQVEYIKEQCKNTNKETGYRSCATNSGNRSCATNSGDCSCATNSGYCSCATNSGYCSCATNSGNRSCAEVEKENSAAFAFGYQARARAKDGWTIIVDWRKDEDGNKYIENIYSAKVGGKIKNKKIKSNVWYWFEDGELKSEAD